MTSTTPPQALVLSGVDQARLQREFARAFPQPKKEEEWLYFSYHWGDCLLRGMQKNPNYKSK